jgi:DNA primase
VKAAATVRTADDWVERVRAASDVVEVVSQRVALKRSGRNMVGLCPFHEEKTPSFAVHPERQFYHCFSCKAGGDVFKFVQETEKIGFREAAELLSRRAGIPVPERVTGERSVRGPLLDALEAAATWYAQVLGDPTQGAAVRRYLEERGIQPDTSRAYRLGHAPAGWEHLSRRLRDRFPEEVLIEAGLCARRDRDRTLYDRFRNRLMVPLVAPAGTVIGFGARALAAEDQPKYLNSPETAVYRKSAFLFGLDQARRGADEQGELVVVEGYFDAIALHQAGVTNVVATSGTALTPEQAKLLKRAAPRVALTYDGDDAGQEAMLRSLAVLLAAELDVWIVTLPAGEDPDTVVRRGGMDAWRATRAAALDPVGFIERHTLGRDRADARERGVQDVVQLAAGIEDPVRRGLLVERAAQTFGLAEAVVARAVAQRRSGPRVAPAGSPAPAPVTRAMAHGERLVERELLQGLLHAPDLLDETRAFVGPGDFADAACAALAQALWDEGEPPPEGDGAALARELEAGAGDYDWASVVRGRTRQLMRRGLEDRRRAGRHALRRLLDSGRGEDPEVFRLMKEDEDLKRRITELNR